MGIRLSLLHGPLAFLSGIRNPPCRGDLWPHFVGDFIGAFEPGNLLLLGQWTRPDGKTSPVIGAPGCARSPKENGFDWVLQRLMAGLAVTREDMMRMGHGGLLMEIVQRGQLRADLGTVE